MPIFDRGAPITVLPSGYQPELDRLPPSSGAGCWRTLLLILLFIGILAGMVIGVIALVSGQQSQETPPTPIEETLHATFTPTPTPSPDSWAATGTALALATASATPTASPTADYCAFLTPTATHTPTLIYTPDEWAATGTAIYLSTQTVTPIPSPTPTTPRAWCDTYLPTATITPLSLEMLNTQPPTPTTAPPTRTPFIAPPVQEQPVYPVQPIVMPTNPPSVFMPPTLAPPLPQPTFTQTATDIPTETPIPLPTAFPLLQIKASDCTYGYPIFAIDNFGAPALNVYWAIYAAPVELIATGLWDEIPANTTVMADASVALDIDGEYLFALWQPWNPHTPTLNETLRCGDAPPTPTEPVILPATATLQPELTPELTPEATGELP